MGSARWTVASLKHAFNSSLRDGAIADASYTYRRVKKYFPQIPIAPPVGRVY